MAKFKTGDIVSLKSGGPDMTVEGYVFDEDYQTGAKTMTSLVKVSYWSGNKYEKSTFEEDMLESE